MAATQIALLRRPSQENPAKSTCPPCAGSGPRSRKGSENGIRTSRPLNQQWPFGFGNRKAARTSSGLILPRPEEKEDETEQSRCPLFLIRSVQSVVRTTRVACFDLADSLPNRTRSPTVYLRRNPVKQKLMRVVSALCGALLLLLVVGAIPRGHAQTATGTNKRASALESGAPTTSVADGHLRMLALLEEIRKRNSVENLYTGADFHAGERHLLKQLRIDSPPAQQARLRLLVGKDELRLGNNQEAIEHLRKAYDLSDSRLVQPAFQLAVAYLRLGEARNCIAHRDAASCILPIRDGGIHRDQDPARTAIQHLTEVLRRQSSHKAARWLLNLAYMTVGGYPAEVPGAFLIPPERFESEQDVPRFRDVALELGLNTVSLSGGAIADDFDGDNWLDLVVSDWNPNGQLRFFRNNGDGTFGERTEEAGFLGLYGGLNLVQADYDSDGDLDVYVLRGAWLEKAGRHPNSLLQNDGNARFRDVTIDAGLGGNHYPTQTAAWADFDNDGDLDLYVGNETFPSQLFRNNGDGTFSDVAVAAGVTNDAVAKGVVWGDYDGDRLPDIYVSNFGAVNRLYRNAGDGTFSDVAAEANVTYPFKSFPTWFWDFNNDGSLDLFVSGYERRVDDVAAHFMGLPSMETEPDSLYAGDGSGSFRDVGFEVNLNHITQPMGSNFGDLDNDGFLDFYLGTGYPEYEGLMPNLLFRNVGGKQFVDVTTSAGVGHLQKGHGVAFADFDHDGDQDLFVELGGAYAGDVYANALFENPGFENNWLVVRLVGVESSACAIGSRIRAVISENGNRRSVYRWVNSGGSFGANPLRQHIGLGRAARVDRLEIYWPASDRTQVFRDVGVNQFVVVREDRDGLEARPYQAVEFGP